MKHTGHISLVVAAMVVAAGLWVPAGLTGAQGGAPAVVSYQGQVTVDGEPYSGTGYFKLAVVDSPTGNGTANAWANDGTASGQPTAAVSLAVANGLFTVLLGDTSLASMTVLPASAFDGTERYLRVWFSTDNTTFTPLEPNRRIAAVPYALQAQEAANADTLDGLHAGAFQQHYDNVVVVAKSGGDYTTITDALNHITASDTDRYLVKVMPGVYNERVTMEPYVDIEGAGELTTRITSGGDADGTTGTLMGADNAEVRFLTVENTGGEGTSYARAIRNGGASPRLTHVAAIARGAIYNTAVYNESSFTVMTDVAATSLGGDDGYGVINSSASPTMTNVTATASGATWNNVGVSNLASSPRMTNVTVTASGGNSSCGVWNESSSATIQDSVIRAGGGAVSYGIQNYNGSGSGPYTVRIDNCQITSSGTTIRNDTAFTLRVGASLLDGGNVFGGGTLTCAGVYDESYAFNASSCP